MVLAFLTEDDPGETVLVHDYSLSRSTGTDFAFRIPKPFNAGYKVGGLQLDELGQRVVIVSADGCYVHLFALDES